MIDFEILEQYQENNRIEAKKAVGGLPHSIWETYSAFANTLGGIILLGVEEYRNKTFHVVKLPDPEQLVSEFRDLLRDPKTANLNILSEKDVTIEDVQGKKIVAIRVPRAPRHLRPIYIGGNPMTGTYRRNGEGDYRCTPEAVQDMIKKAAEHPAKTIPDRVRAIVSYLTEEIQATAAELTSLLDIPAEELENILADLLQKEIIVIKNGFYMLKA